MKLSFNFVIGPACALLLLCAPQTRSQPAEAPPAEDAFTLGADVDRRWLKGTGHMYRLEFDKAEAEFRTLLQEKPGHPAGDLAFAALMWWQLSQNYDTSKDYGIFETEFTSHTLKAIEKCKAKLEDEPNNATAYFIMGTAYGLMGRWYAVERRWWKAYTHGSKGRKYLKKAIELNPRIYDAFLGLGIFDYYSDTLPGVLKLSALLFVHGDRKRGLEEINTAIEKGRFFTTEARLFKMGILLQFENKGDEAIAMAQTLRKEQPDNNFFRFCEVATRFNANDWHGTIQEGEKYLNEKIADTNEMLSQQLALVYLAVGDAYLMTGDYQTAVTMFTHGIESTKYPEKGWVTYCYLRRAQAYDIMDLRDKALANYKIAFERDNFWDTREQAKPGLRKPYKLKDIKKQIETH